MQGFNKVLDEFGLLFPDVVDLMPSAEYSTHSRAQAFVHFNEGQNKGQKSHKQNLLLLVVCQLFSLVLIAFSKVSWTKWGRKSLYFNAIKYTYKWQIHKIENVCCNVCRVSIQKNQGKRDLKKGSFMLWFSLDCDKNLKLLLAIWDFHY